MKSPLKYDADVIIIGAGPTGSRTAAGLAYSGYDVILLERRPSLGQPVCCTGIISAQCLAQFDIDPDLILRRYNAAKINTPDGSVIDINRHSVQAVAVDRGLFDRRMAEKAVASGASLILGATATSTEINRDCATVHFSQGDSPCSLKAKVIVVAAGLSPRLTGPLGLGKISNAALGFQVEVETPSPLGVELYLGRRLVPGFFGWIAPVSETRAKVGLISRRRADGNLGGFIKTLQIQGKIGAPLTEMSCRPIPLSPLRRTYADRVLVVGDSAGQVKATTGGGLYYGLVCADLAVGTIRRAFAAGDFSSRSLRNYQNAWHSALGRDLLIGRLGRSMFQLLNDHQIDRLLVKARDSGLIARLIADNDLSFDWHGRALFKALPGLVASFFK
jgi:digeranylgeranylglycerophospholipid reductase